MKEQFFS